MEIEKVDVKFLNKHQYLCEIGQPTKMQFAFLSPDNEQCHVWVLCRDFLADALRCRISQEQEEIYGFTYTPKSDPPVDINRMRIMVKHSSIQKTKEFSKEFQEIICHSLKMIRAIEKNFGIAPLSNIYQTKGNEDIYIFEGAKDWMSSTFMISLYSFLIRLGAKKIEFKGKEDLYAKLKKLAKNSTSDHDIFYLKQVLPFLDKIMENREKLCYKKDKTAYLQGEGINLFHNYSGIVSLVTYAVAKKHSESDKKRLAELIELSSCIK